MFYGEIWKILSKLQCPHRLENLENAQKFFHAWKNHGIWKLMKYHGKCMDLIWKGWLVANISISFSVGALKLSSYLFLWIVKLIWSSAWQNQQNDLCAQRRLRSAWASAQSDQSSLSAWRNIGPLTIYWVLSEDTDQTGRMPRLIWVFAGRTDNFVGFVMRRLTSHCW